MPSIFSSCKLYLLIRSINFFLRCTLFKNKKINIRPHKCKVLSTADTFDNTSNRCTDSFHTNNSPNIRQDKALTDSNKRNIHDPNSLLTHRNKKPRIALLTDCLGIDIFLMNSSCLFPKTIHRKYIKIKYTCQYNYKK